MSNKPLGTNFSEIFIKMQKFLPENWFSVGRQRAITSVDTDLCQHVTRLQLATPHKTTPGVESGVWAVGRYVLCDVAIS